jgi:hypothetical protein
MGRVCSIHGEKGNAYRVLVGIQKELDHLEGLDKGGKII